MNSYEIVADWVTDQHNLRKDYPLYTPRLYDQALWEFTSTFDRKILYEDHDVAVINKPPYVLSLASDYDDTSFGVEEMGKFMWGEEAALAHRLDRNTSGAMIVAKNFGSLIELKAQFARQTRTPIEKYYIALLEGELTDRKKVSALLNYHGNFGFVIPDESQADATTRTSKTIIEPIDTYGNNGDCYTAALVQILTGRTHQIRIVTSHLGHPVIGDSRYNNGPKHIAPRQLLHAWHINFTHPTTKKRIEIEAPVPEDMLEWVRSNQYHSQITA